MGIKSTNMLKNLGTYLLAFAFLAVMVVLLLVLKNIMLRFTLTTKVYSILEGKIFYNSLIRSLLTSYLTMSISCLLSIQNLKTETTADIASCGITIATLALIVIAPFLAHQF